MEEITNLIKEKELEIQRIKNKRNSHKNDYLDKRRELLKIARSDFLTGGIIASSLFIIISSLTNFFGILFPYDLLIGISGFFIGLIVLLIPIARSKFADKIFNKKFLGVMNKFQTEIFEIANLARNEIFKAQDKNKINDMMDKSDKVFNMGLIGLVRLTRYSPPTISKKIRESNIKFIKDFTSIQNYYLRENIMAKIWIGLITPPNINKGNNLDEKGQSILHYIGELINRNIKHKIKSIKWKKESKKRVKKSVEKYINDINGLETT